MCCVWQHINIYVLQPLTHFQKYTTAWCFGMHESVCVCVSRCVGVPLKKCNATATHLLKNSTFLCLLGMKILCSFPTCIDVHLAIMASPQKTQALSDAWGGGGLLTLRLSSHIGATCVFSVFPCVIFVDAKLL